MQKTMVQILASLPPTLGHLGWVPYPWFQPRQVPTIEDTSGATKQKALYLWPHLSLLNEINTFKKKTLPQNCLNWRILVVPWKQEIPFACLLPCLCFKSGLGEFSDIPLHKAEHQLLIWQASCSVSGKKQCHVERLPWFWCWVPGCWSCSLHDGSWAHFNVLSNATLS